VLHTILCPVLVVFIIVLVLRAVLSWFPPPQSGSGMTQVNGILHDLTEWALRPLRQIIPPVGMFDVSFMVLLFGLILLQRAVC
jgi:YggT family protein